MTEWEKAQAGYLYDANYDEELIKARSKCADLCYEFNNCKPSDTRKQNELLHQILGSIKGELVVTAPFYCDYGFNISVGKNFYTNHNCIILDGAKVVFGDNVFIAPNCVFSTAGHAIDAEQRGEGLEIALPIQVGDNVWIGANACILPGVVIGDNTVIGAGSVVNKNIPSGVVAAGNPCRVIREITEADRHKYPIWGEEAKNL
ncbi:MAG: sugar O-acetyltransferase [Butyrivibrio sp.]|nr:sugar O-acetyltransferase [Muribaculum sp.]MCM1551760.1 sugar O-acetyltransferase [Butyrivibrio sp.]